MSSRTMISVLSAAALRLSPQSWVFAMAFGGYCLLKSHVFSQPPVWDTAMGVLPPALWLHHNGFDIATLTDLPSWTDGGPNVYSLSLITWLTAAVITVCGGTMMWLPAMHLLHLLATAATIAGVFWLAQRAIHRPAAILVTLATALLPVFATQAGHLYLEMPVAAATIGAMVEVTRRRHGRAALWATIAMAVQPRALVITAVVAFAASLQKAPIATRVRRVTLALLGPAFLLALNIWNAKSGTNPWQFEYMDYLKDCYHRMRTMPDVLAMLGFATLAAVVTLPRTIAALHQPAPSHSDAVDDGGDGEALKPRAIAVCCLAVLAFVGFVAAVPLSGAGTQPLLPRHIVQIAGPMMIAGASAVAMFIPKRIVVVGGMLLCVFFVANASGRFYPPEHRSFAVAERSNAYRDFLSVQQAIIDKATQLPADVPMFYPLPDHYFFSDPLMGYATRAPSRGHCLRFEQPYKHGRLKDFPGRFFLLDSNPYHGGEAISKLVKAVEADPKRSVSERWHFAAGGYSGRILEVH